MRRPANYALFLISLCLVWAIGPTPAAAQEGPRDLRCENATNPRGVKTPQPQLSWTLSPAVVQHAYQILVASSEEKLKADEGNLWDSGKVISAQKTVPYHGKALSSLQHCYWKVRIWGAYYSPSGYTETANWEMGLLFFDKPEAK
jgi:alpha-L-rhamnosidase